MAESAILPPHFKLLYSREEIAAEVKRLGADISAWAADVWRASQTDVVAIPVLGGAIFFFADLVREISRSVMIAPARAQGYNTASNVQRDKLEISIERVPCKGRSVLLVDDICDSGRTLGVLTKKLSEAGALEVRSAVLLRRELPTETFTPNWVGFSYSGTEWLVGYGMDDADRWRNLPSIYIIRQPD